MVTTRSMSRTANKTDTDTTSSKKMPENSNMRMVSRAKSGTTKKVDTKNAVKLPKSIETVGKFAKWSYCTKRDIIMIGALSQFMKKEYLKRYYEEHPPRPFGTIPYVVDHAGQLEWRNMSDIKKRPWIELAEKMWAEGRIYN